MGIVIKQGIIGTIIIYIGIALGFANVIWLFPRFFETDEFGLRTLLTDNVSILAQFSLFGLTSSILKFFPFFEDKEGARKGYTSFMLIAYIIFFSFFSFIYYVFIEAFFIQSYVGNSPLFVKYSYLIIPLLFLYTFNVLLEAIMKSWYNIVWSNFTREVLTRVLTTVIIFFFAFSFISFDQFWIAFVMIYGVNSLTLLSVLIKTKKIEFSIKKESLQKPFLKQFLVYSFFSFLVGAGSILVLKIDVSMIGQLLSETEVGIYAMAIFFATIIDIPRRAIVQITSPIVSKLWKENDYEGLKSIYKKTSINLQLAGSLLFLLIWINIDDLYAFIPNNSDYLQGKYVVFFLGIAKLSDMLFSVNADIIVFSARYKMNLVFNLTLAALTIITNYFFIQLWGITGAAIATTLSITLVNMIRFIYIKRAFQLSPFQWNNSWLMLFSLLIFAIGMFLKPNLHFIVNVFINSTLIVGAFALLVYKTSISEDAKAVLKKGLSFVFKTLKN